MFPRAYAQPAPPNRVLELDGNDSSIELPADLLKDVKNELTVEGWIRWERLGNWARFFDFGPAWQSFAIIQALDSSNLSVVVHMGENSAQSARALDVLRTNRWYHFACTVSEAGTRLYVNGTLAAYERFVPNVEQFRTGPHRLGLGWDPTNDHGRRQMDEIRVWSVARSEEQIRQSMWEKLTGREPGLLGCWNFDSGDATDLTLAQRHGIPHGTSRFPAKDAPTSSDLLMPAQIEGTVKDASGQPLAFARVTLNRPGGQPLPNVLTGATGSPLAQYRFTVFNPATHLFELTAAEGARTVVRGIRLQAGQKLSLDLTLGDPGNISGTLRTFDPAVFHAVVPVQLIDASNQVVATVLSDSSGRYVFTNVPPAAYQIRCQVLNGYRYLGVTNLVKYADAAFPNGPRGAQRLTLIAGQKIENADFTFAPFKKGHWTTYSVGDGLASKNVWKILPLDDGTLWIATMGGLSIFDGATFKNLRKEDGLPDNRIFNLHREPNGTIWICTGNGVARFDPKAACGQQIRSYTSADGLPSGMIWAVCQTPDAAMWFGFRGISRFDGTTFQSFPATDLLSMPVMKMQASKDGPLWLGTYGSGLLRYDATNFTAIPSPKECFRLALGPEGTIWFGSYDRGLCRYSPTGSTNPSELRNFTKSDGLMENSVIGGIHFTPDGVLWVGAGNGVSRFDGTNFVNFTVVDGLPGYNVSSIVTTADGMHWFGTEGGGLIRYDPKSFESYTTADGLSDNDVLAGHRLPDGTLWVGTGINPLRESGLNRLQEERFIEVPLPDDDKGRVKRFRAISDGVLVVGEFARAPAYRLEHSMLVPVFTGTEPRVSGSVDVLAASDGSIWLAGGKDDGTWSTGSAAKAWQAQRGVDGTWKLRSFSPADFAGEQPMPDLISLGLDNQGRIWTGWYVGVGRYENGEWRLFTLKDGLAGDRIEMIGQIGMAHFGSPPTAACRDSMERISSTLRVRRAGSPAILFSSFSGTREAISGWGRIAV